MLPGFFPYFERFWHFVHIPKHPNFYVKKYWLVLRMSNDASKDLVGGVRKGKTQLLFQKQTH